MHISDVIKSRSVQLAATGVVSFVGGYFVARRTIKRMEMDDIVRTIEEFNLPNIVNVQNIIEAEGYISDNEALEVSVEDHPSQTTIDRPRRVIEVPNEGEPVDYTKMFTGEGADVPKLSLVPTTPEEKLLVNIFADPIEWDEEKEKETRDPSKPYVISEEEYFDNDMGFKQETLTFYELDEVMIDPADNIIHRWPEQLGELKWGHGCKNKFSVYIRNEKLRREWEVLCEVKSYAEEVQGLEAEREEEQELRHARPMKFRED